MRNERQRRIERVRGRLRSLASRRSLSGPVMDALVLRQAGVRRGMALEVAALLPETLARIELALGDYEKGRLTCSS